MFFFSFLESTFMGRWDLAGEGKSVSFDDCLFIFSFIFPALFPFHRSHCSCLSKGSRLCQSATNLGREILRHFSFSVLMRRREFCLEGGVSHTILLHSLAARQFRFLHLWWYELKLLMDSQPQSLLPLSLSSLFLSFSLSFSNDCWNRTQSYKNQTK